MTWQVIARHDGRRTLQSRTSRFLLGILLLIISIGAYIFPVVESEPITTATFSSFLAGAITVFVPLVGLVLSYNAVVSERRSGALVLTLAMPHSRFDVVAGKLLGRAGVLSISILLGLVLAGGLVVYPYGELSLLPFVGFCLLTLAFGLLYTGLGIAISIATSTKQRATVAAFGIYFLFVAIWAQLEAAVAFVLRTTGIIDGELPDVITFIFAAEPGRIYGRIITGFIDPTESLEGPWYLNEWIALGLFLLWMVFPVLIAYRWFNRVDL